MPAGTGPADLAWLKSRSPCPLMADEAYLSAAELPHCAEFYHAANVKLVKPAGSAGRLRGLAGRAQGRGYETIVLSCMIESSVLIGHRRPSGRTDRFPGPRRQFAHHQRYRSPGRRRRAGDVFRRKHGPTGLRVRNSHRPTIRPKPFGLRRRFTSSSSGSPIDMPPQPATATARTKTQPPPSRRLSTTARPMVGARQRAEPGPAWKKSVCATGQPFPVPRACFFRVSG